MEKYPQLVGEGIAKRDIIELEKADAELNKTEMLIMEAQGSHMDSRQRFQHNSFTRPSFQQANGTNLTQQVEKDPRKEAQLTAKRRSKSRSQTPARVGSPASVNNVGDPVNASSPSINTPQPADQSMTERFAKIELVAKRNQLNCEKNKVDEISRTPRVFSAQELVVCLSSATNSEYVKDETCTRPLSQSLVGGSMNVCKIRVINVHPEQTVQGNIIPVSSVVRTRMIMSEKPNDGSVAMHYGDLGDEDYLNAEDHLPTLPNTHLADLLAAQFCALKAREGYSVEHHVQPRPPHISIPSNTQPNAPGVTINETKPTTVIRTATTAPVNSTSNLVPSSVHKICLIIPQVSMPNRPQHMDSQQTLQNQPSLMPHQQPQLQQQPQGPQQVTQMQRMMMVGPAMGTGAIGNNMIGLPGISDLTGIGGAREMGPISGIGLDVAQNQMSVSQHFHAGTFNQHQAQAAMLQKQRWLQSQGMLGQIHSCKPSIPGAAQQMEVGSTGLFMLGQAQMKRGNISPIQRRMRKSMTGMNVPLTLQQMLQLQQQQHMQQHVGSPSTLGIPQPINQQVTQQQQQASPANSKLGQQNPMSPPLSSGRMHPVSAEVCPASPALSSQTIGSVGSITNYRMDLQGVNKSNSVT